MHMMVSSLHYDPYVFTTLTFVPVSIYKYCVCLYNPLSNAFKETITENRVDLSRYRNY